MQTVFVTGTFDLLHIGHVTFLNQAKALVGEQGKLIVAVLSDHEVQRRKAPGRPIFKQEERLQILKSLCAVDQVILWDKPWEQLRSYILELKPDYLAVVEGDPGLDNKKAQIEKAGGKLVVFPKIDGYSTSEIINRIQNL